MPRPALLLEVDQGGRDLVSSVLSRCLDMREMACVSLGSAAARLWQVWAATCMEAKGRSSPPKEAPRDQGSPPSRLSA